MRARRAIVHFGAHADACMHDVGVRSRGHDTPRFCVRSWSRAAAPAPPHSCRQGGALGVRIRVRMRTLIAQLAGPPPRSTWAAATQHAAFAASSAQALVRYKSIAGTNEACSGHSQFDLDACRGGA